MRAQEAAEGSDEGALARVVAGSRGSGTWAGRRGRASLFAFGKVGFAKIW